MAKAEAKPEEVTEDDKLFWSYVAEEERPTTLYHLGDREVDEVVERSDAPQDSDGDGDSSLDLNDIYL